MPSPLLSLKLPLLVWAQKNWSHYSIALAPIFSTQLHLIKLEKQKSKWLGRKAERAERKWKKDKLQVSYQHLRYCLAKYQQCIKAERTKYFSDIIFKHVHRPKVLFNTINKVHNPAVTNCHEATSDNCEYFLRFFTSKLDTIQSQISPPAYDLSDLSSCSSVLTNFEPFSLSSLTHIISHMKPCTCPLDLIPPRLLKEVLDTVGPCILSIINSSLCLWLCPSLL